MAVLAWREPGLRGLVLGLYRIRLIADVVIGVVAARCSRGQGRIQSGV